MLCNRNRFSVDLWLAREAVVFAGRLLFFSCCVVLYRQTEWVNLPLPAGLVQKNCVRYIMSNVVLIACLLSKSGWKFSFFKLQQVILLQCYASNSPHPWDTWDWKDEWTTSFKRFPWGLLFLFLRGNDIKYNRHSQLLFYNLNRGFKCKQTERKRHSVQPRSRMTHLCWDPKHKKMTGH